jgi:hypothetical protein
MSRARKRKQPEDVTYIDILRAKGKLPGWDLEPISSLRITNMTLMPLTPNASEAVRKAREYFYLWVKRDHWYPHMLCRTPEPLRLLIMGIYGLKGIILTTSRVDAFVEPISGYVHHGSGLAVPVHDPKDIWPTRNHKIVDRNRIPRSVKLLSMEDFRALIKIEVGCFYASLGRNSVSKQ